MKLAKFNYESFTFAKKSLAFFLKHSRESSISISNKNSFKILLHPVKQSHPEKKLFTLVSTKKVGLLFQSSYNFKY